MQKKISTQQPQKKNFPVTERDWRLFLSSLGVMGLTVAHHIYGAIIYDTPFRLHIAYVAVPVILVLVVSYRMYWNNPHSIPGKIAFRFFMVTAILIPIGTIGYYEGGYNHLMKNILYFGGTSQAALNQLFPPETYEMPNDFWFEATGILQFFLGIYGAYWFVEVMKRRRAVK